MPNTLYKIYYGDEVVYLGRTTQPMRDRIRGHVFHTHPIYRVLDINKITRIECTELLTVADMYLYEIYYINKLKPEANCDDKARDDLTITLPELVWLTWETKLWDKWKNQINERNL